MADKNKKEKDYSSSYEKGISINPMTDAFSMDEDKPSIAGAIGRGVKQVPSQGRIMDEFVKMRTGYSNAGDATLDAAKTAGALGVGYVAGRSDERPSKKMSDSKSSIDYSRVDSEGNSFAKGGMSVEEYSHAQKNPHAKKAYKDGGEIHITKGHDYIKDLIK
jgi:hypothetical protein